MMDGRPVCSNFSLSARLFERNRPHQWADCPIMELAPEAGAASASRALAKYQTCELAHSPELGVADYFHKEC